MPITREEFDAGQRSLGRALLWFLREHADLAYSAEELLFELGALGLISTPAGLERELTTLMGRDRVESKELEGTLYYSYVRTFGLRPPVT